MHCGVGEKKGQSLKCVGEEERKSRDWPSAYAYVARDANSMKTCRVHAWVEARSTKHDIALAEPPNRRVSRHDDDQHDHRHSAAHLVVNYCLVDTVTMSSDLSLQN